MLNFKCSSDLVVFSHAHFGADDTRTSRLMSQFAANRRVYFIDSPVIGSFPIPTYFMEKSAEGVTIIRPYLPGDLSIFEQKAAMQEILKELISDENICHYTIWTDTPKAMPFIRNLGPEIIVYDCVKSYIFTHPELEKELYQHADVVLTSGLTDHSPSEDEYSYLKTSESDVQQASIG